MSALSAVLTYGVAKFGWDLDVAEIMTLVGIVQAPFLIYIGAEGYSEAEAKRVMEENKVRAELTDKVLDKVAKEITSNEEN